MCLYWMKNVCPGKHTVAQRVKTPCWSLSVALGVMNPICLIHAACRPQTFWLDLLTGVNHASPPGGGDSLMFCRTITVSWSDFLFTPEAKRTCSSYEILTRFNPDNSPHAAGGESIPSSKILLCSNPYVDSWILKRRFNSHKTTMVQKINHMSGNSTYDKAGHFPKDDVSQNRTQRHFTALSEYVAVRWF